MGFVRLIWRGDLYGVDLRTPIGHEPGFQRPAVVVSSDILNNGPGGLVTIVPITTTRYGLRSHIELDPGISGLEHTSYARCDQLRAVSVDRLLIRWGMVGPDELGDIDRALRFVLDL
ncbi:MAG: type II toxin-antitoxin system PemK/MazF family toxin [Microthrixaceae bacterium]